MSQITFYHPLTPRLSTFHVRNTIFKALLWKNKSAQRPVWGMFFTSPAVMTSPPEVMWKADRECSSWGYARSQFPVGTLSKGVLSEVRKTQDWEHKGVHSETHECAYYPKYQAWSHAFHAHCHLWLCLYSYYQALWWWDCLKASTSLLMWLSDSMPFHCCHPSKHTHLLHAKGGKSPTWLQETTYSKIHLLS